MDQRRQPPATQLQYAILHISHPFLQYLVVDASTLKKFLYLLVINILLSHVLVYFGVLFNLGPMYEL